MTRTLRYLLLIVFTGLSGAVFAQGEIGGTVVDDKKEPLINAFVQVFQGGILKAGVITDLDGNYSAKPLEPGKYDVFVFYQGFDTLETRGVLVTGGQRTKLNITLKRPEGGTTLKEHTVVAYRVPLVNPEGGGVHTMTKDDIAKILSTDIKDVAAIAPAIYQQKRGADQNIGGARTSGTTYIIDGVVVQGTIGVGMSQNGVEQLEVMTSGISAKYGDVSGGVISITSRSVAQKLTGNVRAQHSIDGYNNNLLSFSVAGPIYKKKEGNTKKSVLGFSLSGDYYDDHNRYPAFDKQWIAKDDYLNRVLANPLRVGSDNTGGQTYTYESFYATFADLKQVKQVPDARLQEIRGNGKLDFQMTDNMRIAAGGNFDYQKYNLYSQSDRRRSLFNYPATPIQHDLTGRGYIRFTQKFGKTNDTSAKSSRISNAFYSVQADFQRLAQKTEDPKFGSNIFNYGYVGKFNENRTDVYVANQKDSTASAIMTAITGQEQDVTGTIRLFNPITSITYDRSDLNPTLANYTTQYYNTLEGDLPFSIPQIQGNALANGDQPRATYSADGVGMFYSPGATQSYYTRYRSDQYALAVDASFDLQLGKTRHAIEFGLYYQQRIIRSYTNYSNQGGINGGTTSLWSLMRGLVSSPGGSLVYDKTAPIYIVGGKQYTAADLQNGTVIFGPNDTVLYNYKNIGTSTFDKNLRKKLGVADNAVVNIDAVDPSQLSLDMFSADELLNLSGNSYVDYYGYSYTGAAQSGAVNFNDFWTKKDVNGNYLRPIGAFSPNYIAGYILDRFHYKDMSFNVGLRVDRYSANTKVLVDPYSLYEEYRVNQVAGANNFINGGQHPSNMGSDYVVYVNDNNSTNPTVVGYRNGNAWYDAKGTFIEDPAVLKKYTGGRDPQPFLVKEPNGKLTTMSDSTFNPNRSFTDYNPQVTLQPRLQFTFPISDVSNFYAHYDIYAQRPYPTGLGIATAWDYFKLSQVAPTSDIPNANLRSQKTFDYEVGFQQKLSSSSALTITGYYKERKDMINLVRYVNAYPYSYVTYGNRDFSTTKGTTLNYDMRATNNLSMNVSYTLQFAEGTGSTPTAGRGFLSSIIQEGLPNLRYVTPLDYDSRHIINARVDYRYGDGEGPIIAGRKVFQNAGLNFIVRTRSGEPYTRYTEAVGATVIGGVNGSRLPWHFNTDLRFDKDFALSFGKRNKDAIEGVRPRRTKYVKAVIYVNNLFNTREILRVYGYTGKPDDNGYLSSSFGQQFVPQQIDPQSYTDLYTIYMRNPNNLNYARTVNLSLEFNF